MSFKLRFRVVKFLGMIGADKQPRPATLLDSVGSIFDGKILFRKVESFIFDDEKNIIHFSDGHHYLIDDLMVDDDFVFHQYDKMLDESLELFGPKKHDHAQEFMSEMVEIFIKARNEKIEELSNDGAWKENDWIVVEYALRKVFGEDTTKGELLGDSGTGFLPHDFMSLSFRDAVAIESIISSYCDEYSLNEEQLIASNKLDDFLMTKKR